MMEENLFICVKQSPVMHAVSQFSVRKECHKKERKEKKEWHLERLTAHAQVLSVFYPEVTCITLRWLYITL